MDLDTALRTLELEESANINEIRTAYRDLSEVWHPDKYMNNPRLVERAEAKMKEINLAYEVALKHAKDKESSLGKKTTNQSAHEEQSEVTVCPHCGVTNCINLSDTDKILNCGACGKPLKKEASSFEDREKCADGTCGGTIQEDGKCEECGKTIDEVKGGDEEQKVRQEQQHPWRRFFARCIDMWWWGIFLIPVFYFMAFLFPNESADLAKISENPITAYIIFFGLWFPVEGALISSLGTTPGKFLFGISVRSASGQKLKIEEAVIRSFRVLLQGIALGIPFVAFFTQIFAYRRLTRTGTTLWDKASGSVVAYEQWGVSRALLCTFAVIFTFVLIGMSEVLNGLPDISYRTPSSTSSIEGSASSRTEKKQNVTSKSAISNQPGDRLDQLPKRQTSTNLPAALRQDDDETVDQTTSYDLPAALRDSSSANLTSLRNQSKQFNKVGKDYARSGQTEKALWAFQQAVHYNKYNASAWNNLCFIYHGKKRYAKAIEACQQALKIMPDHSIARRNLDTIYKEYSR